MELVSLSTIWSFNDQELLLRVYVLSGIFVSSHYLLCTELLQTSKISLDNRSTCEDMSWLRYKQSLTSSFYIFFRPVRSHTLNYQWSSAFYFSSKHIEKKEKITHFFISDPTCQKRLVGLACSLSMGISYKRDREQERSQSIWGLQFNARAHLEGLFLPWHAESDGGCDFHVLQILASLAPSLAITGAILPYKMWERIGATCVTALNI